MTTAEPEQQIRRLKKDAEALLTDYRRALGEYKQSQGQAPIIGEIVGRFFDAPPNKIEKALTPTGWELTPAYSTLEGRFRNLFERSKSFLNSVAKQTARGSRRKLGGSLRPVTQAARLETKVKKLLSALESHEMDELVFVEDIPKSKRKTAIRSKPSAAKRDPLLAIETAAVTWVSVFVTSAVGFYFALSPVIGLFAILGAIGLAGLLTYALLRTRKLWIPRFRKVLERR